MNQIMKFYAYLQKGYVFLLQLHCSTLFFVNNCNNTAGMIHIIQILNDTAAEGWRRQKWFKTWAMNAHKHVCLSKWNGSWLSYEWWTTDMHVSAFSAYEWADRIDRMHARAQCSCIAYVGVQESFSHHIPSLMTRRYCSRHLPTKTLKKNEDRNTIL